MTSSYFTGYALGIVMAGFLFSSPAWILAKLWNKFLPDKRVNPWKLPFITSLVVFFLASLGVSGLEFSPDNELWVMMLGLFPSVAWYGFRFYRHREVSEESSL